MRPYWAPSAPGLGVLGYPWCRTLFRCLFACSYPSFMPPSRHSDHLEPTLTHLLTDQPKPQNLNEQKCLALVDALTAVVVRVVVVDIFFSLHGLVCCAVPHMKWGSSSACSFRSYSRTRCYWSSFFVDACVVVSSRTYIYSGVLALLLLFFAS